MAKNNPPEPSAKPEVSDPKLILERKRFTVEKITLAVLTFYAGVAAVQAYLMYRATTATERTAKVASDTLTNTRNQFLAEQRPIVWVANDLGTPKFIPKPGQTEAGQILWTVHYTNYGKTPAKLERISKTMKLDDQSFTSYGGSSDREISVPLAPGKDDMSTVISQPGITREQFNKLSKQPLPGGISISMTFSYTDVYGEKYETGVCLIRLNLGSIGYCEKGNYIK